ncbi:glycogen/starch synthase, ADP-glucose type [Oceanithermus profundus DSM 14977]|uniref:Glycogen synthase n=1 Tax=Oceanithermus profundus (strain DSM 14977 / NBRC 100410 / VKM B-2274 / 506) TaxID=670487 RepID=E4U697_OCEP5|nr:glycogen/starch synthase [Oceanithermus profundus]ADR35517.1 glycogen/starch synthase, ADP-glucose type [Oceanithermus profundus DSM 14977]
MRVVHVAAEALPFVKVGGLADVLGSLPRALAATGVRSTVLLPRYREIADPLEPLGEVAYRCCGEARRARVWGAALGGVAYRFLEVDPDWSAPYEPPEDARYLAFTQAAATWLAEQDHDLVHAHDWHAAYVVRRAPRPAVFTIHNLAFQGELEPDRFERLTGEAPEADLLHEGRVNLMKGALLAADRVTTVSPRYAREIQTPEFGMGLDAVLRSIRGKLTGILNGLDTEYWNPATDGFLPQKYDADHLERKRRNRMTLLATLRLDPGLPAVGAVTRLTWQKGFDLVLEVLPRILDLGVNFVLLGTGEAELERGFAEAARRYPRRVAFHAAFDEARAHRIYGGADYFLMPSRYEPCGLAQMIAMRYGTPPIARATGGLADTVEDGVTGVLFEEASGEGVLAGVRRILDLDAEALARAGMARDFSWGRRAQAYRELYEEAVS